MKPSITTISVEKPLLDRARKAAKVRRQSFSSYVATLIETDLLKARMQDKHLAKAA